MDDDYQRYRREQEEAVSNQAGSSAVDVILAILPNICSILLALTVITLGGAQMSPQTRVLVEFAATIVPCVLCCTVLADKVLAVSQIFLIISAANIMSILAWKPRDSFKSVPAPTTNKLAFITNFRATVNVITVVCILAVDFRCFPRKFAKTETFGYSLMDTGVGLFMVANALVSPEARNLEATAVKTPFIEGISKTVKGCLPLLGLGLIRFVCVEVLGYQRHVSEYGVHWNFFLTLAFVRLFTGLLSKNLTSKYSLLTGLWILAMHEYALSTKGLKEWVLSDEPRDDLMSANREGWVSIPGYVGLYLVGVALGRLIYSTYQNADNQLILNGKISSYEFHIGYTRSMALAVKLYVLGVIAFIATYYCEQYFRVSRRLANSGYCAWILTLSLVTLILLLMIEVILECITGCVREKTRRKIAKPLRRDSLNAKESVNIVKTLEISEAVNDNGLVFFLFANVLTGAINMSMRTLRVDESRAVAILIAYMVVNVSFVFLRNRGKLVLAAKKSN